MSTEPTNSRTLLQETNVSARDGYVVGIDIGGTNLRLALADGNGVVIARGSATTYDSRSADAVVHLIRSGVEELLEQACVPRSALRVVAAGAPGVTDVDAGVVIATSYLLGWRDVPLRDLLETAFGIPAMVDNDVNLAALGESRSGTAVGIKDFVFLAIGTGVGSGIVLNGQLFRGTAWSAGEIGYMFVPGAPDGPADRGKPGALEEMIGGEGIRAQWHRLWRADGTTLPQTLTATEVFDGAVRGDPLAQALLRQSARILAYAIYNMSLVLNCPLFVLGGGVGMHSALRKAPRELLDQWGARASIQLRHSALESDAQLIGAIQLALDTASRGTIKP
jgi:glucokinase